MPSIKAVVNLPYTTGLPRDVSQQTYCFIVPDASEEKLDDLCDTLARFYNVSAGVGATTFGRYLSSVVDRAFCWIDLYNVSITPSGPPIHSKPFTFGPAYATQSLPLEVALVQSFQGVKVSSMPQSRRRGRNYLGPFCSQAMGAEAGLPRPSGEIVACIAAAAERLANEVIDNDIGEWCVWSRSTGLFVPVANGWINNEWDTQRRREAKETDRVRWFLEEE